MIVTRSTRRPSRFVAVIHPSPDRIVTFAQLAIQAIQILVRDAVADVAKAQDVRLRLVQRLEITTLGNLLPHRAREITEVVVQLGETVTAVAL
jgi:hypothetical protein